MPTTKQTVLPDDSHWLVICDWLLDIPGKLTLSAPTEKRFFSYKEAEEFFTRMSKDQQCTSCRLQEVKTLLWSYVTSEE